MTARAEMERATWEAVTKWKRAIADGTWQRTADNALVDAILKAWERSVTGLVRPQRRPAAAGFVRDPEAAAARIRAQIIYGDDPDIQAERRQILDAYAIRSGT